jgi:glutathionyl-hydroquinone reductase
VAFAVNSAYQWTKCKLKDLVPSGRGKEATNCIRGDAFTQLQGVNVIYSAVQAGVALKGVRDSQDAYDKALTELEKQLVRAEEKLEATQKRIAEGKAAMSAIKGINKMRETIDAHCAKQAKTRQSNEPQ